MEKKFEFTSNYDFVSKLRDMYVVLNYKGIHVPTIMKSDGCQIPLFGEFKTHQPVKFIIRIGRFGKWKNRDGTVAQFNTEEEANVFLNKVVKRVYHGPSSVEQEDEAAGTATYRLAESTAEILKSLDKKRICLYSEWSSSMVSDFSEEQKEIITNLQLQDEHDNAVLSSIKANFIEAWNASKKKAAEKAQREEEHKAAEARAAKIEAERMKFPLYKLFSTIERWDIDNEEFKKLESKAAWIKAAAAADRSHRIEMEKLRKADPEPADGGFFGDSGWYDE